MLHLPRTLASTAVRLRPWLVVGALIGGLMASPLTSAGPTTAGQAAARAGALPDTAPAAIAELPTADALAHFLIERGILTPRTALAPNDGPAADGFVERLRQRTFDLVAASMNFLGVPYRRGGNSADEGFDCSGFTRYVYEHTIGLVLPRRAEEQASAAGLERIPRDELLPGDLVFFNTLRRSFSHVGIYVGDGKFIHAPRTGAAVRVEDMRFAYWARRFTGARRASAEAAPAAAGSTGSETRRP